MKRLLSGPLLVFALFVFMALSACPVRADLVNPGFEDSDKWTPCDGWSYSGPANFRPVIETGSLHIESTAYTAPEGSNFLYLSKSNAAADRRVYQSFTLEGPSDVRLWYSVHGTGRIMLSRPDGTSLLDYCITGGRQADWIEWQAIPPAGDYTLSYMVRGKSSWGVFDNRTLASSEVPLPGSLLLFASGLIAALAIGRRVRK